VLKSVLNVRNDWVKVEWVEREEELSVICIKFVVKRKGRDQRTERGVMYMTMTSSDFQGYLATACFLYCFRTYVQQLRRFQLSKCVARSLCDGWAFYASMACMDSFRILKHRVVDAVVCLLLQKEEIACHQYRATNIWRGQLLCSLLVSILAMLCSYYITSCTNLTIWIRCTCCLDDIDATLMMDLLQKCMQEIVLTLALLISVPVTVCSAS